MQFVFAATIGYLFGSLPFSYLVPRLVKGIDIRTVGSGNVGSTNVYRSCGVVWALVAFLGDFTKGLIATIITNYFWGYEAGLVAAAAAMIGHCYTYLLNFKGGKGVATFAGIILYLDPFIFLILAAFVLLLIFTVRIVSLASIIGVTTLAILAIALNRSQTFILFCLLVGLFVIFQHRSNIKRLLNGTEKRLTKKG